MNIPKFYLIDSNIFVVQAYAEYIRHDNWRFIPGEIVDSILMEKYDIDAFVSPANSKGDMDGGVDQTFLHYFGYEIENRVKRWIDNDYAGFLPVGNAIIVPTDDKRVTNLVVSPTMVKPGPVYDPYDIYLAAKALFSRIKEHNLNTKSDKRHQINNIAMTGLGTGIGMLDPKVSAFQASRAYSFVFEG
jgi:O-acetyl-ADP-ribose deacetylase (regulator of RNase III)